MAIMANISGRKLKLRHELKYVIDMGSLEILRSRMRTVMKTDPYAGENGDYRVTSLYFDDIYRTAYNDKLGGFKNRIKYRIRAYNFSTAKITLEAKRKDGDLVSKSSTALSEDLYRQLLAGDCSAGFEERFKGTSFESMAAVSAAVMLTPAVITDYVREAYINREGNVRITFDKFLSTSYGTYDMFKENAVFSPVFDNGIILEVKYDEFIPPHIEALISGVTLNRQAVSKFVICADALKKLHKVII